MSGPTHLRVTMPDGSLWDVPVDVIARNRAERYKDEFGDDVERSLVEDTLPLFASDNRQIRSWAAGNMDWSDVRDVARQVPHYDRPPVDFQEGWVNGEKELVCIAAKRSDSRE